MNLLVACARVSELLHASFCDDLSLSLSASLGPLLEEGFEAKAFATATIQNQMVGDTLQKLANGIAALDKELYSQVLTPRVFLSLVGCSDAMLTFVQVVNNYEDLLSQATGIEALEGTYCICTRVS